MLPQSAASPAPTQHLITMRSLTAGVIFYILILSAPVSSEGQSVPVKTESECSLVMDGEEHQGVMVTSVGEAREVAVTGWGECGLTLLVVGGGGRDGGGSSTRGGAGSGYMEYRSLQVAAGTVLTARVGDQGQPSSLAISSGDTVTAPPGQGGHSRGGGAGHSGGGGGSGLLSGGEGGDGGSDGGDGEDGQYGRGGRGSGHHLALYTFTTWSLTPGAGGQHYGNGGGGGGGLLVDGAGPQLSSYQGQGYGGGGMGHYYDYGEGLPGLILIEVN